MDPLEEEILEVVRQQPAKNPDGKEWKIRIGSKKYTRAYILENWGKDEEMQRGVTKRIIGLKLHLLKE